MVDILLINNNSALQMDSWFSQSMRGILSVLGIGLLSLSMVAGIIISRIRGSVKPFIKPCLLYLLFYAFVFAVVGLLIALHIFQSYTQYFIFFQLLFIGLGVLHVHTLYKYLKWVNEKTFWAEVIFTIVVAAAGGLCFMMVYRYFRRDEMDITMLTSAIGFIIPLFVYYTYKRAIAIPFKILKQWFYPLQAEASEPDEKKLKNLLVISFEFLKKKMISIIPTSERKPLRIWTLANCSIILLMITTSGIRTLLFLI
ncbi:TssN family type VI secretion system protein [Niabella ginsengisoli]|uniref:TssN family type VI secretion system protein n=1 Tax=Niabella ginsengisoli TaxID=522298 RepID=A0ABS9SLF9_9BACT|nr:TssN family type VI secretion system protein [Niabella ginsengisoli]MCH5599217.1 TssN family type VI secretion system protein [Niabella ginsengisoli]